MSAGTSGGDPLPPPAGNPLTGVLESLARAAAFAAGNPASAVGDGESAVKPVKLAPLPPAPVGGARKVARVEDLPRYSDSPCPRPERGPALAEKFDCAGTRGYLAVQKTNSAGALYEYTTLHAAIAFLYDSVQYFGEVLTGDQPDKSSLHVVFTHLTAVLDLLVQQADT